MLPEHLKIGYEIVRVGVQPEADPHEGVYTPISGTIQVAPGMSARRTIAALLHEILHAVWDHAELPQGDAEIGALVEEDVVSRLSNGLTQVLLDNPMLLDSLGQAAQNANGTFWKPSEQYKNVGAEPKPSWRQAAADRLDDIINSCDDATEINREASPMWRNPHAEPAVNKEMPQRGSVPGSVQVERPMCRKTLITKCWTPEMCEYLGDCARLVGVLNPSPV